MNAVSQAAYKRDHPEAARALELGVLLHRIASQGFVEALSMMTGLDLDRLMHAMDAATTAASECMNDPATMADAEQLEKRMVTAVVVALVTFTPTTPPTPDPPTNGGVRDEDNPLHWRTAAHANHDA